MRASSDAPTAMTPTSPSLLDRLPSLVWFFSGMLIASLVVGLLLALAQSQSPATPPPTAQAAADTVAMVRCPPSPSPRDLIHAAACGDTDGLRALLAAGTDPSLTDTRATFSGRTALHHAVQRGDEAQVDLLLAAGARPDLPDSHGNTPLHLLALNDEAPHPDIIARRLIAAGARLDVRNSAGNTPIEALESDHARLLARQNLALVLVRAGKTTTDASTDNAPAAAAAPPLASSVDTPPAPTESTTPTQDTRSAAADGASRPPVVADVVTAPDPADGVRAALEDWREAWSTKNMPAYFARYHPSFIPEHGLSHTAWVQQRQARIGDKAGDIRVALRELSIEVDGERAVADFTQVYSARDYHETARKQLELLKAGEQWQILREHVTD